uniref:Putative secreted peptide n=1 Tax=Anopheles braziliensis TaxID=58242 RepID=A0A2M3ZWN7_9DIPT
MWGTRGERSVVMALLNLTPAALLAGTRSVWVTCGGSRISRRKTVAAPSWCRTSSCCCCRGYRSSTWSWRSGSGCGRVRSASGTRCPPTSAASASRPPSSATSWHFTTTPSLPGA